MSNRLADELSPYLLQHAENPVDWYPWSDDAFGRARAEEKPIFLSVGYSTCHWCHVMEVESFENSEVAAVLNENFVSIKVDREERPDVDRVYMAFVQATTGSGGWPMSVWLTPDLKPFFGGTYFPPNSRWGRPGFTEILREISKMWADNPHKLRESGDSLLKRLREPQHSGVDVKDGPDRVMSGPEILVQGVNHFAQTFDATHGGFGSAPKFPRPSELLFLLREHVRAGDKRPRDMVIATLRAMADSGMRDHVGGGFHRYSVDAAWRIPHFEKMLYDQSQLILAFLEAGQLTGDERFLDVAEDTLAYVLGELTGSEGGFFSAEDADSFDPGGGEEATGVKMEGAFYLWTSDEIDALLGADAALVRQRYGVKVGGNAPQDPSGEFSGKNQLFLAQTVEELSVQLGCSPWGIERSLVQARQVLRDARSRRPRPSLDDKVLAAWNGLMIAALARASFVFDGSSRANQALEAAQRAARFIRARLWDKERLILYRRYREGQRSIEGYAEDYACLAWGLLELFQADGDVGWLQWAQTLQSRQDELFWDNEYGGWFSTTGLDSSVLLRLKDDYDGAEPSAGSISVGNLQTLFHLTAAFDVRDRLERALNRFNSQLGQAVRVAPLMASGLSQYHAGTSQLVIVGEVKGSDTLALKHRVAAHFLPFTVRVYTEPGPQQDALSRVMPFVGKMTMLDGKATAYLCTDFSCRAPVNDPDELESQLVALKQDLLS